MNYELAKELKEAGFPQHGDGEWLLPEEETPGLYGIYTPTLSELIEACGEGFASLDYWPEAPVNEHWEVASGRDFLKEPGKVNYNIVLYGPTPEEAVARLWLALNKK